MDMIKKMIKPLSRFVKMSAAFFCFLSFCTYFSSFLIFLCLGIKDIKSNFCVLLTWIGVALFLLAAVFSGVSIYKGVKKEGHQ